MYRKWKSVAALGMAVLIGCSMPMGTMLAAEENPEAVQEVEVDSASDTDAASDDETVLDDKGIEGDEIDADDENAVDEVDADDENAVDEVDADDEIADEEGIAVNDGNAGIAVMSAADAEEGGIAVQEDTAAPVIDIKFNGQSCSYSLGGKIDFEYVNNHDQAFACSASQDGQSVSVSYYLEMVSDTNAEAKGIEKMSSLKWESANPERILLSKDRSYVLYVKAVGADGQPVYARSGGVVVDTVAPAITELVEGKTYPEGTKFQVSDANLESVKVNETLVTPESDGSYRVIANGTSCVISLKDKAGNEKVYNINVSKGPSEDGIISESGLYSLKADTSYQLVAGTWQVGGDSTVYQGGRTFYVKSAGYYSFTKR